MVQIQQVRRQIKYIQKDVKSELLYQTEEDFSVRGLIVYGNTLYISQSAFMNSPRYKSNIVQIDLSNRKSSMWDSDHLYTLRASVMGSCYIPFSIKQLGVRRNFIFQNHDIQENLLYYLGLLLVDTVCFRITQKAFCSKKQRLS